MPESKSSSGGEDAKKRQLPSWMSAGDEENNDNKSPEAKSDEKKRKPSTSPIFSKLLEGVVFVLSGFVNPERSTLRSQAMAMGAEYQSDWNSRCTLLICAFPNTPKFRQVESDCGTIVAKEWISECYQQKRLVDIDTYLMHAGKPWRISSSVRAVSHAEQTSQARNADEADEKKVQRKAATASSSKKAQPEPVKEFYPSKVKQWVKDDLNKTLLWLQSQEKKPEPNEMNDIAAQGILTCIQDAIDLLEKNQDIGEVIEQWSCIPHIVKELESLAKTCLTPASKEDLHKQALNYKQIYQSELQRLADQSVRVETKPKNGKNTQISLNPSGDDGAGYDSDDTIEMTEEEIDMAYKLAAS